MYMTVANAFQTAQTFILTKEPLPENLQKLVDEQEKAEKGRDNLPFERKGGKKKKKPQVKQKIHERDQNPTGSNLA